MLPCKLCQSKPVKKAYWNCPNVGCSLCETLLNAKEWNILMSDFRRPELSVDTLVRLNAELCLGLELNTIHTICTKFTAPEAKQSIDMKNLRFEIHRLVSLNVSNVAEVAITIKEIFDYLNDIES